MLSERAEKKWNQLDVNQDGTLTGGEVSELAAWVWCSFRPGQQITAQDREKESAKILRRCDANENGTIDKAEFCEYYEKTAAAMFKFHKAHAKKISPHTMPSPAEMTTPATPAEIDEVDSMPNNLYL